MSGARSLAAGLPRPLSGNRWNRLRYTLLAPVYDRIVGFAAQRRRSIVLLGLRPGERVLIVGAGTGLDLPHLPEGVSITAVDLAPAMVERTRRRALALGRDVEACAMDAERLDVPDGAFDAVVLHLIVAVVADPAACVREAARVLTPGGRSVVFDKFVPEGQRPSLARRLANVATSVVFSDITRALGPLLAGTGLRVERREAAGLGGAYQIALLRKGGRDDAASARGGPEAVRDRGVVGPPTKRR